MTQDRPIPTNVFNAEITSPTESPSSPPPFPEGRKVHRSTYYWLALGVAAILIASLLPRWFHPTEDSTDTTNRAPSASETKDATGAELQTRLAFGIVALQNVGLDRTGGSPSRKTNKEDGAHTYFGSAIKSYRRLLKNPSPNVPRRLLVLEHRQGKPLDEKLLTTDLVNDLRKDKVSEADIRTELTLWRALYGTSKEPLPADSEQRIEKMHLRLVGTQAFIDLFAHEKNETRREALRQERDKASLGFLLLASCAGLCGICASLTGIGVLFYFLFTVVRERGSSAEVSASETASFADLIDVFAFYFACFESSRVVFSILFGVVLRPVRDAILHSGSNTPLILLELTAYLVPHLLGAWYLHRLLRRKNLSWDVVGASRKQLFLHIGHGILGYCAALPLLYLLSQISEAIFRNNRDISPNPAITFLTAQEDMAGRILLFLMIAVAAPLCEELFFRGVLVAGLRRRYGFVLSVLLSSVAFSLGHPIQDWIPILGLGVVFGTLRDRYQSLVPSITAHFLQNSMTYLLLSVLFGGK